MRRRWHWNQPVYPRECGGTWPLPDAGKNVPGLSPRVRGNRQGGVQVGLIPRSIPASAGEPVWYPLRRRPRQVYPRECGGTFGLDGLCNLEPGLSPRVRGNLLIPMLKPS